MAAIEQYQQDLLTSSQLKLVLPDYNNYWWFTHEYQSRVEKPHPEYFNLRQIIKAVENSEREFKQFDVDERNIKALAKSIFVDDTWLQRDIVVSKCEEQLYIVGGRHRAEAIAYVFAQVCRNTKTSDRTFDRMLEQKIRCELLFIREFRDLLILIQADNEGRRIRKVEQTHLEAQVLGVSPDNKASIAETVLSAAINPTKACEIAAHNFVRRQDNSRLTPQTRQLIGERVAKYILFGVPVDARLKNTHKLKINTVAEFNIAMDKAWEITSQVVKERLSHNDLRLALKAREIAVDVVLLLSSKAI